MVDTNSDPNLVDYAIPCNDDASKAISLVVGTLCKAIDEGLSERKADKDKEGPKDKKPAAKKETKTTAKKSAAKKDAEPVEAKAPEAEAETKETKE